jgi:hypothetical protein
MKRIIARIAATAATIAATVAVVGPAAAQAASDPHVGSIYVKSWTFPHHTALRTAVDVSFAPPGRDWSHDRIKYAIWRRVSGHWRLAHTRWSDVCCGLPTEPNGALRDVQWWYIFQFHHTGAFRWRASLVTPGGARVSTAFRYFHIT